MEITLLKVQGFKQGEEQLGISIQVQIDFLVPYRKQGYQDMEIIAEFDDKVRVVEAQYQILEAQESWDDAIIEENQVIVEFDKLIAKKDVTCSLLVTYYTHPKLEALLKRQEIVLHDIFSIDFGPELGFAEWHRFTIVNQDEGVSMIQIIDPSRLDAFFDLGKYLRSEEYVFLIDEHYNLIHGLEKKIDESVMQLTYILVRPTTVAVALNQVLQAIMEERLSIEMLQDEMSLEVLIDIGIMVEGFPYGEELMEVGIQELEVMEQTLASKEKKIKRILRQLSK